MSRSTLGAIFFCLSLFVGPPSFARDPGNKPGGWGGGGWLGDLGEGPFVPGQVIQLPGGGSYTVPTPKNYLNDKKAMQEALAGLGSPEVRQRAVQYCQEYGDDCNAYISALVAFDQRGEAGAGRSPDAFFYMKQIKNAKLLDTIREDSRVERDWEKLHGVSEQIISQNPNRPQGYLGAADAALGMGRPQDAIKYLEDGLEQNPGSAELYSKLAQAKYQSGDMKGAFESGRQAMELGAKDSGTFTLTKMAQQQMARGGGAPEPGDGNAGAGGPAPDMPQSADPVFNPPGAGQISSAQFQASDRLYKNAQGMLRAHDFSGAVEAATKALQYNDKNAAALYTRSLAFMQMGRHQQALQDIEAALTLAPRNDTLLLAKSSILNRMGQYGSALSIAKQVAQMRPDSAEAYHNMAWAFAGLGDRAEAVSALQRAASLDARFQPLYRQALQLPQDADLAALFLGGPGGDASRPAKKEGAGRGSSLLVWIGTILGGILVAFLAVLALTREGGGKIKRAARSLAWTSPRVGEKAVPREGAPTLAGVGGGGDIIGGSFRILRQIGAGGMGVVHEAVDVTLERHVAVKKMREEIRSDPRERERFLREAKTVAALHHPNIVEIYRIVEENLDVYLVFEYVEGRTIHEVMRGRKTMPVPEAVAVLRGICAALEFAHKRNVIHRDLKPANVMLDAEGRVKVMDFGVARITQDSLSRLCMTNTVVGTPPYMAPEQEQGMVRRESDLYALAVCFYEMVTGQLPFSGVGAGMLMAKINKTYIPPSRVTAGLPAGLDAWMDKALDPEPDKRWRTAAEFIDSLESAV
ncbi:MAG: hypothetical protein A2X36_05905 [Elusimicrobia bacterium GWA2_69_24]|nr:MAG: hypothetical protein A2X36_05905 [Elusimicrobia bacterium GWA2_69_24]HBL16073.1 hypothetical protein [Elusimicrobiota bacterium]